VFEIFQFASRTDPLANRKSARLWASSLPPNDALGAVDKVAALVSGPIAMQQPLTLQRARAILELDRIADPWQQQLRAQSRLSSLSEDVRERLWQACDRAARGFGHAYERVCEALREEHPDDRTRMILHAAFARLFFYVGLQARLGLFRYERWIPGRWRALHGAYSEACRVGIVAEPFVLDADSPAQALTPEQEYLQILLLHRLNTGNLSPQQIDLAAEWLREWVPALGLAIKQPEGDGYWLDLGQGDGLLSQQPTEPAGELLYLDVGPLRATLRDAESTLAAQLEDAGTSPEAESVALQLDLARRLSVLWFPQAPPAERRGERHPQHRTATVALTWPEIESALSIAALQRSTAPAGYYYDDYGRLRPQRPGMTPSEPRKTDFDIWQVLDSSESGYRLRTVLHRGGPLRIGAMLALRVEDEARWQLGIVRRLKRINAEQNEAGVEVISRAVVLVAPKSGARQSTGYTVDGVDVGMKTNSFNALYLPGQSRLRGGARPSIVLPPSEFTIGRALSLSIDGHLHDVVLAPPLERTKDWVWTPLELGLRH
jgi:hypothetical protein